MGIIPLTGQAKMFEGAPTTPSDFNSIQSAIRGTLDNPSQADTKNMLQLRNLAKLDMFVPKRTTLPIDAVAFRGFPRPTVSVLNYSDSYDVGGNLIINFRISLNNKVGYNLSFLYRFEVGDDPEDGVTLHTFNIPAGQTFVDCSFHRFDVPNSTGWDVFLDSNSPNYTVYDRHNITGFSGFAQTNPTINFYPYSVQVNAYANAVCYDPNDPELGDPTLYPQYTHYIQRPLTFGSEAHLNSTGNSPVPDGSFITRFPQPAGSGTDTRNFVYTINNGVVVTFSNC